MAKLNASKRKAIPDSEFGLPESKKYPMPDKAHAVNAKARSTQAVNSGKMNKTTKAKIDSKANKILGDDKMKKKVEPKKKAPVKKPADTSRYKY